MCIPSQSPIISVVLCVQAGDLTRAEPRWGTRPLSTGRTTVVPDGGVTSVAFGPLPPADDSSHRPRDEANVSHKGASRRLKHTNSMLLAQLYINRASGDHGSGHDGAAYARLGMTAAGVSRRGSSRRGGGSRGSHRAEQAIPRRHSHITQDVSRNLSRAERLKLWQSRASLAATRRHAQTEETSDRSSGGAASKSTGRSIQTAVVVASPVDSTYEHNLRRTIVYDSGPSLPLPRPPLDVSLSQASELGPLPIPNTSGLPGAMMRENSTQEVAAVLTDRATEPYAARGIVEAPNGLIAPVGSMMYSSVVSPSLAPMSIQDRVARSRAGRVLLSPVAESGVYPPRRASVGSAVYAAADGYRPGSVPKYQPLAPRPAFGAAAPPRTQPSESPLVSSLPESLPATDSASPPQSLQDMLGTSSAGDASHSSPFAQRALRAASEKSVNPATASMQHMLRAKSGMVAPRVSSFLRGLMATGSDRVPPHAGSGLSAVPAEPPAMTEPAVYVERILHAASAVVSKKRRKSFGDAAHAGASISPLPAVATRKLSHSAIDMPSLPVGAHAGPALPAAGVSPGIADGADPARVTGDGGETNSSGMQGGPTSRSGAVSVLSTRRAMGGPDGDGDEFVGSGAYSETSTPPTFWMMVLDALAQLWDSTVVRSFVDADAERDVVVVLRVQMVSLTGRVLANCVVLHCIAYLCVFLQMRAAVWYFGICAAAVLASAILLAAIGFVASISQVLTACVVVAFTLVCAWLSRRSRSWAGQTLRRSSLVTWSVTGTVVVYYFMCMVGLLWHAPCRGNNCVIPIAENEDDAVREL